MGHLKIPRGRTGRADSAEPRVRRRPWPGSVRLLPRVPIGLLLLCWLLLSLPSTAQDAAPDIRLTARDSRDPVLLGTQLTYTLRLDNTGTAAAAPITLRATLAQGLSSVSISAPGFDCQLLPQGLECLQGSLPSGASVVVSLRANADTVGFHEVTAQAELEGDSDPSNNQVALQTSVLAQDGSLIFPVRLDRLHPLFQDTFVGVAIFNPSEDSRSAAAYVRRVDGSLVRQFLLDPPLEAQSQLSRLASEIGQGDSEAAVIEVFGLEGPVRGFFLVGDFSGRRLDGLGEELLNLEEFVLPLARCGEDAATLVYLFNPNRSAFAQVQMQLFDAQGEMRGEFEMLMPPSSTQARTIKDFFASEEEEFEIEDGYVTVQSTFPLRAFELQATPEAILSAAARQPERTRLLDVPHFAASNRGTDTIFRLINMGQEPLTAEFRIFSEFSTGSGTLTRTAQPGQVLTASALEMLDEANRPPPGGPPVNLSGFVRLDAFVQSGAVRRESDVVGTVSVQTPRAVSILPIQAEPQNDGLFLQVAHDDESNIFTGLVIYNPGRQIANVEVEIFTAEGERQQSKNLLVFPNARAINLLASPTYFGNGFSQLGGHFRIRSNQPVFTMALFGDFSQRFLASIAAQESPDPAN
ncbi:MAG TPA: DUF11 domain-containing protein [Acidobacteriota bacterium]|nr:DUF11 domain-containing protein [Acidobacteriota bacterium]